MCFVVSMYLMNISFHVLRMFDLDRFLAEMWVLALQPKMRVCSTFCLTSVQASSGTTMNLSARLVDKRFYK